MLSVEHCMRRAERFKIKMLTSDEPVRRARLIALANGYRSLAETAYPTYTPLPPGDRDQAEITPPFDRLR
jgi:hypothetical protein